MVSRRNEPGIPPTPVAETFLVVNNDQHNNGDDKYDWFKNMPLEETIRGSSWRLFKEESKERKKKEK
jgi:hypothetical protein